MVHKNTAEHVHKSVTPHLPSRSWSTQKSRFELPCFDWDEKLLYMGFFETPGWYMPLHYHEHFELCVIAAGSGRFYTHQLTYPVQEGDLFISKPGEHHSGVSNNHAPLQVYYFGFNPGRFSNLQTNFYQLTTNHVTGYPGQSLVPLCRAMITEAQREKPYHIAVIQGIFLQLLANVLRIFAETTNTPKAQQGISKPIHHALELIHRNQVTSLDEVASKVHLSKSHLARLFRKEVGVSMGEYIRTIRLDQAKHLLRETDAAISAIAEDLSFASIHSFSSFFKRYTGRSPSEYRKC